MRKLKQFIHLNAAERWALLQAAAWITALRLGLKLLPFRTVHQRVAKWATPPRHVRKCVLPAERLSWAVETAGRALGASCLPRAMAGLIILRQRGYVVDLHIGVRQEDDLIAHAWIEYDGRVIIGNRHDLDTYTRLPTLWSASN